jgi:hypothetical protein
MKTNHIQLTGFRESFSIAEEIRQSQKRKEVHKMLVKQSQKITNARKRAIYQEMKRK